MPHENKKGYGRRLLERTAIALLVVTLIFSRQFALMLDESNRFFAHWTVTEGLMLIALVSLISLLAVCISVLVDALRSQWITKIFQHVFVIALASGLLTLYQFSSRPSGWISIIWLFVVGIVGFSLGYPGSRLVKVARVSALIFSPLVLILFLQTVTLSSWGTDPQPRITLEESDESKTPVFFFIFDAWSYGKSTRDGEFHSYFENLRSLMSRAFVFNQARSPGPHTTQSLPMILYQEDFPLGEWDDIFEPWLGEKNAEHGDLASLFDRARAQNYSTVLVGIYFPYCRIFSEELDYCFTDSFEMGGRDVSWKMLRMLVNNLRYLNDPVSQRIDKRFIRMVHSKGFYERSKRFVNETLWQLEHSTSNTFAFFHLPFPHWPYVINPDGSYFGHKGDDYRGPRDEPGYVRHLKYLDNVLGSMVNSLKDSGNYDKSLIILTADHASSLERHSEDLRTHVPLIIKLPGQKKSYSIDMRTQNNHLSPIIEAVMQGHVDEAKILELIQNGD